MKNEKLLAHPPRWYDIVWKLSLRNHDPPQGSRLGITTHHNGMILSVSSLLGITTLHNDMILSTLSISSHGFIFGFSKSLVLTEMYSLLINPWSTATAWEGDSYNAFVVVTGIDDEQG